MGSDLSSLAGFLENLLTCVALRFRGAASPPHPQNDDFLLGYLLRTAGEPVYLLEEDRCKHVYCIGATGAGKSNTLIRMVESDFRRRKSAVVFDLRGDLVDRILLRLKSKDELQRISLIDLRQEDYILPFNPLNGVGHPSGRALLILGIIKKEAESWGIQLDETLRYTLLALCEAGGSLLQVEQLLTDASFRADLLRRVTDPYVRSFFDRYGGMSKERQQSWAAPVLNKVSVCWTVPLLRRMFDSQQNVNWSQWIDTPGQLTLIALAVHRLQSAAHLMGSLLISALQNAIMARADEPAELLNPVSLYVDEFQTLATPAFNALIAEGRRFGVSLTLAHQNLSQIESSLRQTIRNNVQTQILFQCGSPDATELAGDINAEEPRDVIRRSLQQQKVGEAYLSRRGKPSLRIATVHEPDPRVGQDHLRNVKTTVLRQSCSLASNAAAAGSTNKGVQHVRRPRI